jgi:hypothetical protein
MTRAFPAKSILSRNGASFLTSTNEISHWEHRGVSRHLGFGGIFVCCGGSEKVVPSVLIRACATTHRNRMKRTFSEIGTWAKPSSVLVRLFHATFPVYSTSQIIALHPEMIYQPVENQLPMPGASVVASLPEPSGVAVLPSRDYRENLHSIKTANFGQPSLSKGNP